MSKFLSGTLRKILVGITGYTENKTVLQTTGKVGIGTTDAQQHSLFVVGSTNITGDTIVGGGLTAVGISSFQSDVYIDNQLYVGGVNVTGGASVGEDITTRNLKATGISTFVGITTVESTLFTNQLSVSGVSTFNGTVNYIDTTDNTLGDPDTGAIQIDGGLGVNKNVTVGAGLSVVSGFNVAGVSTFQDNVNLGDNDKLRFGDGSDLQIYHDGSNSYIDNTSGSLYLRDDGFGAIYLQPTSGEESIIANANGSVELYYDNTKRLETLGIGATVTGTIFTNQLSVSGISTFNGLVDINADGQANSFKVEDLTDNRIVIAGVGGELEDDGNLTFDGNTLSVGTHLDVDGHTELDNVNVSGIATIASLDVQTNFDVYDTTATFHNNVYIAGNLGIGGTSTFITAQDLQVYDRDIILGITTDSNGEDISNDITANHGGVAVASTVGSPLVDLALEGFSDLPSTYKQLMWVAGNSYGIGTTDAWHFNYAVGIGSTLVPNGTRFAVKEIQFTDDTINTPNIYVSENATVVGDLDVDGHTELDNLNVTGLSTFVGITTNQSTLFANQLSVSGFSTLTNLQVDGISPDGSDFGNAQYLLRAVGDGTWEWADVPGIFSVNNILNGFNVSDEGLIVGTAGSITQLDFRGVNITASADPQPNGIATITMSETPTFESLNVTGLSTFVGIVTTQSTLFTDQLSVAGVSTFVGVGTFNGDLYVGGDLYVQDDLVFDSFIAREINVTQTANLQDLYVAGLSTFVGVATAQNTLFANQLNVSGVSTFYDRAIFDSTNSIQIPVGTEGEKDAVGVAVTGQIRFNTTNQQFEGFGVGNNWGSLGGVKDVDGDTYILAETTAGSDEDILYFYTGGNLSGILSTTGADLNVDLNVDGHTELDNLNVSGIATFQDNVYVGSAITMYAATGIVSATAFYGDGANLANTGSTLSAASGTQRVVLTDLTSGTMVTSSTDGDLTFNADYNILSVPSINVSTAATFGGTISAGGTVGASGQYLQSTGVGVTWSNIPNLRTTQTNIANDGDTTFAFTYNVNFIDVFVNGVKLTNSEYTAANGTDIILSSPAFEGDIVEFISYNTTSVGSGSDFATKTVDSYTATGGQTTFAATYTVGFVDVYLNGAKLTEDQYTATSGTDIVLDVGATGGDIVEIVGFTAALVSSGYASKWTSDTFGINRISNVGIGTTSKDGYKLYVEGDARVTGILTVGPASVTIDGINNEITVGSGATIYGNSGIISATSFRGNLIGNVTGGLTGNVFGNVTGNVIGDVTGNLTGDVNATNINVTGISTLGNVLVGGATTDVVINGDLRVTGIITTGTSSITIDPEGEKIVVGSALTLGQTQGVQFHTQNLHSAGFEVNNINATGIITATEFSGGDITAVNGTFSGNVSIGGTLTYEDVTNVDSIGVVTARNGIEVGDVSIAATITSAGSATFNGTVAATSFSGDGSALTGIVSIPSGVIVMWSGAVSAIPSGWALCDGTNSTPDLRQRFIVGASGDGSSNVTFNATTGATSGSYSVGVTGGEVSHKLTIAEIPSHRHSLSDYARGGNADNIDTANVNVGEVSENTGYTGGDDYHENRPPYYALAFIMKT